MTRLRHVHTLVRHAARHRIPGAHGPAHRLTALATGAAMTTTVLAAGTPEASAAERQAAPRHPVSTPARPVPPLGTGLTATETIIEDAEGQAPAPRPAYPRAVAQSEKPSQEGAAAPASSLPDGPNSMRLQHHLAKDVLRANGIEWRSTGGCSDRTVTSCTSFENVRWGTIKGLIRFAESSGCEITVTGGTERGHASGPYSHWKGYKLDIAPSECVDRAIKRYPSAGVRSDGARLYRAPDGTLFARETHHWDITFR
ncbi:hypothetical protein [Actinomadura sp. 3N508]|uniref:hypothetical protein n=1 Tax=Actinomadura sp. 3N508 TaxID=3375153 RepID=UPI0037A0F375